MSSKNEDGKSPNIDGETQAVFFGVLDPLLSLIARLLVQHDLKEQSDKHDKPARQ